MKKTLYHGSTLKINKPSLYKGKKYNDYGYGFYCTEDEELAKEWSCKDNEDGVVNIYELELESLKILDLREEKYSILNWLAILLNHRRFSLNNPILIKYRDILIEKYYINILDYDVIIGYRADDSYFSFANAFISNALPLRLLETAMHLGDLGIQVVLVSQKGIDQLKFIGSYEVGSKEYNFKYSCRDFEARELYNTLIEKELHTLEDKYIIDIIRKGD